MRGIPPLTWQRIASPAGDSKPSKPRLSTSTLLTLENVHDVHSIYFEVMGEHGFIGFGLFVLIGLLAWRTGSKVIRECQKDPDRKWAADLAAMTQVSMVGYATGGAFLGLAYFDYYYHLVIILVLTYQIAVKNKWGTLEQDKPADSDTAQATPGNTCS